MDETEVRTLIESEARRLFPLLVEEEFGASIVQIKRFFTSGDLVSATLTLGFPGARYTLPSEDGSNGDVMTTDGNGVVTFQ